MDATRIPWMFKTADCRISLNEVGQMTFPDEAATESLWNRYISADYGHLIPYFMSTGYKNIFNTAEYGAVNLAAKGNENHFNYRKGITVLRKELSACDMVLFFWSASLSCFTPVELFVKAWDDFFYPGDESSVGIILNTERCFYLGGTTLRFTRWKKL